jgi:hypothetical protein
MTLDASSLEMLQKGAVSLQLSAVSREVEPQMHTDSHRWEKLSAVSYRPIAPSVTYASGLSFVPKPDIHSQSWVVISESPPQTAARFPNPHLSVKEVRSYGLFSNELPS